MGLGKIIYTNHSEKRLKERFISKRDVEKGILNNKWEETYSDRKKVVHRINGKKIEVIFKPEDNKIVVVTIYWR